MQPDLLSMPILPKSVERAIQTTLLVCTVALFVLHYLHLPADFPNHSPWVDWSKYTDEGWYGDAAIRHFQLGHWFVLGDFNPAAALPVWPFLEGLLFHFTGVSLVAARALTVSVFAATIVASWLLLWRGRNPHGRTHFAPAAASLMLAASPFCFVFTRLAILEPLLVLLTLLALLAAQRARSWPLQLGLQSDFVAALRANGLVIVSLALLLPLLVLTKTTALFLFPAIAWMLFATLGYRFRRLLLVGSAAAALGLLLWLAYFVLLVRPHFLLDYRYLFSANAYTGITLDNFMDAIVGTIKDGMWIGAVVFPAAVIAVVIAVVRSGSLRQSPVIASLILWAGGYAAFLAYHNNLQPRYYLVVAVPLTLLVPAAIEHLLLPLARRRVTFRLVLGAAGLLVLAIVLPDAYQTIRYVRHPDYTLVEAAREIHDTIAEEEKKDPQHNPLVLSISGSDLSLMTGLHSICDDFGTLELHDRVAKYRPGWYVAWNQIDDDKMDAMTPLFHIERVAAFPAMDDPDRNLLILYRLDPSVPTPLRLRKRKPTPRSLRTRVGQQPSTTQLEH